MAPALGVALTQPPLLGLAVFLSLGLGMAAPFTALAFAPGLLKRIPRPGAWMETFRRVLAFPMYAAAAWLVWVLAQQTDSAGLARLLAIGVLTAFGAWLYGRSQGIEGRKHLLLMTGGTVFLAIAMALAMIGAYAPATSTASGSESGSRPKIGAGGLEAETYSADRLAELRGAGVPVLVDFTAAWCVTCQVNERTTLANPKVVEAFGATNTVYMKADWTNQNAEIFKILSDHGRAGVPLYLLYSADGSEKILPQLLTPRAVIAALKTSIAA
jgi:thiol:disulfide interchange protein DsbD